MYVEIYEMSVYAQKLTVNLIAICDSFSSLLWDVEYYSCGSFEVYISATPENLNIFQKGRIVGRNDDKDNYGIIEKIQLNADAENGDYLTVSGRFLMSFLSRRIIFPIYKFTSETSYYEIVKSVVWRNCLSDKSPGEQLRNLLGLQISNFSSPCWQTTTQLQVSYENLMEWVYKICEIVGGTANIRLEKSDDGDYSLLFELSQGTDRSILQNENPHIVFSDTYNNLLSFDYSLDCSEYSNFAYILGTGEGLQRKRAAFYNGSLPRYFERYEVYVDARDLSNEEQNGDETVQIPASEYTAMLQERGKEKITPVKQVSEFSIATDDRQYQYNRDYFLGDYVTVQHDRFGLKLPKVQLVGMIESFDQNGYSLTPTFRGG
ncbi:MAG: siphovirus ReqiPepy6 Gp37-like family protein [Ruminococcus flavefaciens]|nr:siphovirus ReqiPepy6 Gp37-like family protein [Ruminococcus flavefaciens]